MLHFARSVSAQGRLEQPLTYWNAMGELAAHRVRAVRARWPATPPPARGCGSPPRPPRRRWGWGSTSRFSRGALFACVAGLVALVVAGPAPRAAALRSVLASPRRALAAGAARRSARRHRAARARWARARVRARSRSALLVVAAARRGASPSALLDSPRAHRASCACPAGRR